MLESDYKLVFSPVLFELKRSFDSLMQRDARDDKLQLLGETLALEDMRKDISNDAPEVIFGALDDGVASLSVILVSDGPLYIVPWVTDPEQYILMMLLRHVHITTEEFTQLACNSTVATAPTSEETKVDKKSDADFLFVSVKDEEEEDKDGDSLTKRRRRVSFQAIEDDEIYDILKFSAKLNKEDYFRLAAVPEGVLFRYAYTILWSVFCSQFLFLLIYAFDSQIF
jgi:hypothetical protein